MEITMKSDHRHELKTNELADWITHFPEWVKENAKVLIGGTAIVILAVVVVSWNRYNRTVLAQNRRTDFTRVLTEMELTRQQVGQQSLQGQDQSIILHDSANTLEKLAENSPRNTMAAFAYIKQAEAIRDQLHFKNGRHRQEEVAQLMERAKACYHQALKKAPADNSLVSVAQYGLGLCEEELGNYDEAKTIYESIVSDDQLVGTIGRVSAEYRLTTVDRYKGTIVFPDAPPVLPEATDTPLIDTNSLLPNLAPEIGPVAAPATQTQAETKSETTEVNAPDN
jgi:predicted negative regulator of RcsB-dependent stress response